MIDPTPASPLPTPITSELEVGTLEDALQRGCRRLRFEPPLEAAFERDTGSGRALRHALSAALGALAFWTLTRLNVTQLPEIAGLLTVARLVTVGVCLGVTALLCALRSSLKGWQREALTAAGTLVVVAYMIFVAAHLNAMPGVMQLSTPLLIMLHTSIGARLQCRVALAVNLVICLGYGAAARGDSWEARQVVLNHMLLFGSVLLFGTVGNYLLEFRERRSYVLHRLMARRHDALAADAEKLRQLALRDGLTHLYNRRHFDAEFENAWQSGLQTRRPVAILQIDVDHFKAFNDLYGHPAGDHVLVQVAAVLQGAAERAGGLAARVGGEEFAVLLQDVGTTDLDAVGDDVCASVRALALPHAGSTCATHVTVSVGVAATRPAPGLAASALVAAADAALYVAKRQGRDRPVRGEVQSERVTPNCVRLVADPPTPSPRTTDDPQARIERLSQLLGRSLARLRFPDDLEAEFQGRGPRARGGMKTLLMFGGLAMTLCYVRLCAPVLGEIADLLLGRMAVLGVVALVALEIGRRGGAGWRVHESIVSAIISLMGLTIVWTEATGTAATIYTAALGLCLLPLFSSMVAAQPLRFSLVPSLVVCLGVAVQMTPADAARLPIWRYTVVVVWLATLYSLLGGYLLELSNRRGYLLDRLRVAQLAVLRSNTEHLHRLATLDPLTQLPNRRHFEAELDRMTADSKATREPLALLILDIDHFKHFNDGYGHPAGDVCLQRVAAALGQWTCDGAVQPVPAGSVVAARLGGEEFGVLLQNTDGPAALAAAQRLRLLLRDLRIEHLHSPVGRFVTVSVGAASRVLDGAADARLLLQAADAALYRAKGLGRDQAAA